MKFCEKTRDNSIDPIYPITQFNPNNLDNSIDPIYPINPNNK